MHRFNRGSRAAVALVTALRSSMAEDETQSASQLSSLMRDIVAESNPQELAATMYTLTVMAANPMDGKQLSEFALEISRGLDE